MIYKEYLRKSIFDKDYKEPFRLSKEQLEAIKEQLKMVNERRGIAERKLKKGLWTVDEMIYQTDENIREALQAIVHIVSGEGKTN